MLLTGLFYIIIPLFLIGMIALTRQPWDKAACKELGYNFVLVGDKFEHTKIIKNFKSTAEAFMLIGL